MHNGQRLRPSAHPRSRNMHTHKQNSVSELCWVGAEDGCSCAPWPVHKPSTTGQARRGVFPLPHHAHTPGTTLRMPPGATAGAKSPLPLLHVAMMKPRPHDWGGRGATTPQGLPPITGQVNGTSRLEGPQKKLPPHNHPLPLRPPKPYPYVPATLPAPQQAWTSHHHQAPLALSAPQHTVYRVGQRSTQTATKGTLGVQLFIQ